MLFWGQVLIALGMAAIFTLIFVLVFKRPGPWSAWWAFFLIIFLAAWAGNLWITPAGPAIVGIYWIPIILVAFIFAVLLASISPPSSRQPKVQTISQVKQKESVARTALDIFFWILLTLLIAAIILRYLYPA